MNGCGLKPIGGMELAPVAKERMVPSLCVPSWSKYIREKSWLHITLSN